MKQLGGNLMTVQEVAVQLHLPKSTVYSMIQSGELPGFKIGGRPVRVRPEKLAEYLEKQEKKAYGKAA